MTPDCFKRRIRNHDLLVTIRKRRCRELQNLTRTVAEQEPITQEMIDASGYQDEWERGCQAMQKMREAGVRIIPGGDYGFIWCPHGEYAKDIELFVTDMGFSPMEAIVAATKHGSELMRLADDTGTVEEGKFADLLVVDGDPLADPSVLCDRERIWLVLRLGKPAAGSALELQP